MLHKINYIWISFMDTELGEKSQNHSKESSFDCHPNIRFVEKNLLFWDAEVKGHLKGCFSKAKNINFYVWLHPMSTLCKMRSLTMPAIINILNNFQILSLSQKYSFAITAMALTIKSSTKSTSQSKYTLLVTDEVAMVMLLLSQCF